MYKWRYISEHAVNVPTILPAKLNQALICATAERLGTIVVDVRSPAEITLGQVIQTKTAPIKVKAWT